MSIGKGAPAAALGLFLYLALVLPCPALDERSLSGQTGTLWVDKNGAAFYWDAGLSYTSGRRFFAGINTGQLVSGLAQADGTLDFVLYRGGFDTNSLGLQVSGGFFRHDFLNADFGMPRFYNHGGGGFFINPRLQVHLGPVDINPSFLFAQGSWEQGSFYWFFGKFHIPAIYGYGLSALYNERHQLQFRYLRTNVDILGNDMEELFAANFECFIGSYTLKGGGRTTGFEGTLGWLYTAGTVEGALTMSNQHYVLFPFRFFNLTSSLNMHLGYGLVRFHCSPSFFQFNISLGAANIFMDDVNIIVYYQMKKLFGGSEFYEEIDPVDLTNVGAAFLLFDAGMKLIMRRPRNSSLFFGVQKAFALPWGYEKLINAGTETSSASPSFSGGGPDMEMWRTILLSGLSFHLKLSW